VGRRDGGLHGVNTVASVGDDLRKHRKVGSFHSEACSRERSPCLLRSRLRLGGTGGKRSLLLNSAREVHDLVSML
jgi:hypothetical protein